MESSRFINALRFNKFFWGILCLLFIANLAAYFFVIIPQRSRIDQLYKQYTMKRRTRSARPDTLQTKLAGAKQDIATFKSNLPLRSEFSNIVVEIFDAFRDRGLPVNKMSYKPEPLPEEGLIKYTTSFTVHGRYESLKALLAQIQNSRSLFCIESLTLAGQPSGTEEMVSMNLKIATYFR